MAERGTNAVPGRRTAGLMPPALLSALLVAGCGGGGGESGGNNATEAATTVSEAVDENLYEDQSNRAVPVEAPSNRAVARLPAAMRGRWGLTAADCGPARPDEEGLLIVDPDALHFRESNAHVVSAASTGGRLAVRLFYDGEGRQWTADETLTLIDDGRTLVRETRQPAASLRYARCPA